MREHIDPETIQIPVEEREKPSLVEEISKLKKPHNGVLPALKPRDKMEQACIIIGFNAAIDEAADVARRFVHRICRVIEEHDGLALDNEGDRERLIQALLGNGESETIQHRR